MRISYFLACSLAIENSDSKFYYGLWYYGTMVLWYYGMVLYSNTAKNNNNMMIRKYVRTNNKIKGKSSNYQLETVKIKILVSMLVHSFVTLI